MIKLTPAALVCATLSACGMPTITLPPPPAPPTFSSAFSGKTCVELQAILAERREGVRARLEKRRQEARQAREEQRCEAEQPKKVPLALRSITAGQNIRLGGSARRIPSGYDASGQIVRALIPFGGLADIRTSGRAGRGDRLAHEMRRKKCDGAPPAHWYSMTYEAEYGRDQ